MSYLKIRPLSTGRMLEGEKEIERGIKLVPLPGYTLGFQGVTLSSF